MSNLIKKIRTQSGDAQIDYESLANLPVPDKTLTQEGKAADAKEVGDRLSKLSDEIENKEASGTAEAKVTAHNTSKDAHNDIRLLIQNLANTVTTLLDSNDETLDQTSEIVAYVKSNKSLIDSITTSKVNVSDIIDNLTTNVSNKPLSAAQGVALKALIDGITSVELDESLSDNTKAAPAGMVGELKSNKINTSDIIGNLTTDDNSKVLSAAQGVALKSLVDKKVELPKDNGGNILNGTSGQILQSNGDGTTRWVDKPTTGTGGIAEETDPTVPEWAKQPTKPTYTAHEVGALPDTTKIPSKTSDLQNDSGFLTQHQDLSGYALKSEIPNVASDIGAESEGTAESKVSAHNVSDTAHNDIRLLVQGLTERLNALADSDDETLDQMSEVVAYIKYNRSLINGIDTNKVDVSDIINNLTSNNTNKPLSAKQGRVLKTMIDAITIPEKLPNPNALSITANGTTKTYDGSEVVTIDIPSGSADNNGDTNHYYVTPEQFGAVGDGTNDDTNAINQALASGKPIYFSAKTYKVSSSLTLQTGTRMYGNGAKIFFVPKTELYFGLHLLNISDVLIKDFYFDSERTQTGWAPAGHTRNDLSTSLVDCICIQNSKDIIIENCNFNNMESDFWMQNATAGYSSENIIIRNWYSRNSSMPLFANNSTNVIIENANAEPANIGGDGDHIIYISDGCNHWKINDFTFTAPDDTYGALCTVHGSTEYEGNVIIDNCKFVGKDKVLLYSYVTGEIKIINSILETTESLIGGSFFGNYIIENSDITCGNLSVTSNDSENGNYKIGIKINNCNLECLWEVLAITNGTFIFSNSNIKFSTFFINCRANGKKANVEINRCTIEKTGTTVYFITVRSSKYAFKITHTTFISNTSNTQLMYIAGSDITSLSEYILCGVIVLSTVSNSSISMFSGYSGTLDAKMSGCFYGQE